MTKRNLLLLSLLVVFGLAATAPSLFAAATQGTSWRLSNNENYFARNEGDAEGIGTITLTSLGTGTVAASTYVYIDYNAPIAWNGTSSAPKFSLAVTFGGDDAATLANCVSVGVDTYNADFEVAPIGTLKNNEVVLGFGGSGCASAGQAIDATDTINVVARVMMQGYPNTFTVQGNVRAQYYNTGFPLTLSTNYPQNLNLAEIEGGESAGYSTATAITFYEGPMNVLTCIGIYDVNGTTIDDDFTLNIMENWPNALTSLSDEYSLEHDSVTTGASGFNGVAGAPMNGSNILITLFHIPPGVTVAARQPLPCEDFDVSDPLYCPGGLLTFAAPVAGPVSTGSDGLGVQWFWYKIETTNVGVVENAGFNFTLSSTGPLAAGMGYQITAQVWLTDSYPEDGSSKQANGEMPYFTLPEDSPVVVVNFIDCRTSLLFPYINAYQGGSTQFTSFGTGINVANTTVDPFALPTATCNEATGAGCTYPDMATGSAVPQAGSCTFYFYPANEAAATVYTTPVISAGGSYAFDVGNSATGFQGMTGYAIAICGFQNAHGFAEIYDNYVNLATTGPTATLGYLADVLPDPAFYPRSPAGDLLGETAIAPLGFLFTGAVNGSNKALSGVRPSALRRSAKSAAGRVK